jgi:N-acetyl sugar amidotransferase
MDTTDERITFNERGWCDYCSDYYKNIQPHWHPDEKGEKMIAPLIAKIKKEGKKRSHDCLMGISGGVDSSYCAWLAKEKFGLRPLMFHVDAGWNTETSVHNINRIIDGLKLDLHTEVVDWQEMKDLQVAVLRSQVPYQDLPQDLAFFSALYNFAAKNNFKYIVTGANLATECVRGPSEWSYYLTDMRHVRDIHRRFGKIPLKTFPTADIFKYKLYYRYIKGVRVVKLLDYVPYIKEKAVQEMADRFGWQRYGEKHHESRFTRFYEGYWLPQKFGYDKRRTYLSSLVLTGQMTRAQALERIAKPALDDQAVAQEFEYVAKKLDLTEDELRELFHGENKGYRDYKNNMFLITLGSKVMRFLGAEKRVMR